MVLALWKVFVEEDATLVEVNPLARLGGDKLEALDGKVSLDENAEFRHADHAEFEIKDETDPLEAKAKEKGLNYVKLDGAVGIIGNGAGLVMSTLDVVAYAGEAHGGVKPANFLDIGGGANAAGDGRRPRRDPPRRAGQERCSSTSSAASPPATRSPTASSARSRSSATRRPSRSSYASTATTSRRAGGSSTSRNHPLVTLVDTMDGAADKAAELANAAKLTGATEMSIYLNKDSKIIVQGMTGGMGSKHTTLMLEAGSNIVGGVNARKAGTTVELGGQELPVFGSVKEAMAETGADVSVVFVPPAFTKDACIEAIDAGIGLLVVITEGVPGAGHRRGVGLPRRARAPG